MVGMYVVAEDGQFDFDRVLSMILIRIWTVVSSVDRVR